MINIMQAWEKEFSDLFNACGDVPEECFLNSIIEQRKQAKLEVLDEVLELESCFQTHNDMWIRASDIEKLKESLT